MRWEGADEQGRPILVISPAEVLAAPQAPPLEACAQAVVSQVRHGIHSLVDDSSTSSGMMVVIVDARGITGLQARTLLSCLRPQDRSKASEKGCCCGAVSRQL